jgi:hypothetical protein
MGSMTICFSLLGLYFAIESSAYKTPVAWNWLLKFPTFFDSFNGLRYPLVGGTRQRHFDGTNLKPRKVLENAQSPTSRVHVVLGKPDERQAHRLKKRQH